MLRSERDAHNQKINLTDEIVENLNKKIELTHNKVDTLWQFNEGIARSVLMLRWLGYGLLVFFVFDLIEILIPPNFVNPVWELQTMGAIIERIVVPLLGLVLVFFGERQLRSPWEIPTLRILSWLTLLFAVVLFLLIPLNLVNTIRIEQAQSKQIATQVEQRMTQIQEIKQQLKQATTQDEMESFLRRLDNQDRSLNIENTQQLEEIRKELNRFLDENEVTTQTQAETTRKKQRLALLKSSVKWNLGALVSVMLFILIWQRARKNM
ncbi:MAG: HpsJ family protein [Cyanobacteria bacterium P01_G01_bin.49]